MQSDQWQLQNGLRLLQSGRHREASDIFKEVIKKNRKNYFAVHFLGIIEFKMGNQETAFALMKESLSQQPINLQFYENYAVSLYQSNRVAEALDVCDCALEIDASKAEFLYIKGLSLNKLGKPLDSLSCFDQLMSRQPNNFLWRSERAVVLADCGNLSQAARELKQVLELNPTYAEGFCNYGKMLAKIGCYVNALTSYDRAIVLKPNFVEAINNRGAVLKDLKRYDEAFENYDKAISMNPDFVEAHFNKAIALHEVKDFIGAIPSYKKALELNPNIEFLKGCFLLAKMHLCDWERFDDEISLLENDVADGKCVVYPFSFLALTDSPSEHLKCAQIYAKKQGFAVASVPFLDRGSKIRIGYVSADFRDHPIPQVIGEIIERHNRNKFTVCGFSLLPDDGSMLRAKIKASFDEFYDCHSLDDERVQNLIREKKIDILIDLNGYTAHCRTQIFASRPAPIQVSYMGYAGTMGVSFIDYIIGDRVVFPGCAEDFYSEKLVRMPNSYFCRDRSLLLSEMPQYRKSNGLPEYGFVFCCFSNAYKILPSIFDCWMRALHSAEGSVLWLRNDHPVTMENLKREAARKGVSPERVIFAARVSYSEHLARHQCADLFLDTLPYNAHTTASDALWAGLPVLTHCGESFAGRVAASLLNAVGLPELITHSEAEYETTAIRLAKNPDALAALRQRLVQNKRSSKLFDTPLYVEHLEAAFEEMYERYHSGLPPEHIYVKEWTA